MKALRGVRAQLGLWHASLMALTLMALAGFTYVLLVRVLHSRADAALQEYADTTARQIATALYRSGGPEGDPLRGLRAGPAGASAGRPRFLANDLRSWGRYLQIIDPSGFPVERSDGLNTHPLPVPTRALREGLRGRTTFETVHNLGEHPVRIVTVPVRMGPRVPLLVQAATSLEGVEAALQRAGWILLILTPSVFVLALVVNWLVVGRALRRVDELTRTALEIQSTNLQRRIQHAGPDDEIGRLARAFDQMIARLDRSFQQVKQFSADASHELRTPLTAIRGEAEVALMGELSAEEYRRTLRSILESAERMSEIVESLLLLARADSGQDLIRREPVELGEVILAAMEEQERAAQATGVALGMGDVEALVVSGDPLWLSQIAGNLIGNAVKYTPPGGRVTVYLRAAGEQAELTVEDTGIGIPPEHLPRIFDRFYRVDAGRARKAGGAGLGLSITRWAVEAHGGSIRIDSAPGRGTTVRVLLPRAGGEASGEEALAGADQRASFPKAAYEPGP